MGLWTCILALLCLLSIALATQNHVDTNTNHDSDRHGINVPQAESSTASKVKSRASNDGSPESDKRVPTVAIIGAGTGGLCALKEALDAGFHPTAFDRTGSIGGLWKSAYDSLQLNGSRFGFAFSDFPWPSGTPDFPKAEAVVAYLRAYAVRFSLVSHLELATEVVDVRPKAPTGKVSHERTGDAGWDITTEYVPTGERFTRHFDFLVVAAGRFSNAWRPRFPGQDSFLGTVTHAADYRSAADVGFGAGLTPPRVLVVGNSLTAVELVSELGQVAHEMQGPPILQSTRRASTVITRYMRVKLPQHTNTNNNRDNNNQNHHDDNDNNNDHNNNDNNNNNNNYHNDHNSTNHHNDHGSNNDPQKGNSDYSAPAGSRPFLLIPVDQVTQLQEQTRMFPDHVEIGLGPAHTSSICLSEDYYGLVQQGHIVVHNQDRRAGAQPDTQASTQTTQANTSALHANAPFTFTPHGVVFPSSSSSSSSASVTTPSEVQVDHVLLCTGYTMSLSFLSFELQAQWFAHRTDRQGLARYLYQATLHPNISHAAFVGMHSQTDAYLETMELQARVAIDLFRTAAHTHSKQEGRGRQAVVVISTEEMRQAIQERNALRPRDVEQFEEAGLDLQRSLRELLGVETQWENVQHLFQDHPHPARVRDFFEHARWQPCFSRLSGIGANTEVALAQVRQLVERSPFATLRSNMEPWHRIEAQYHYSGLTWTNDFARMGQPAAGIELVRSAVVPDEWMRACECNEAPRPFRWGNGVGFVCSTPRTITACGECFNGGTPEAMWCPPSWLLVGCRCVWEGGADLLRDWDTCGRACASSGSPSSSSSLSNLPVRKLAGAHGYPPSAVGFYCEFDKQERFREQTCKSHCSAEDGQLLVIFCPWGFAPHTDCNIGCHPVESPAPDGEKTAEIAQTIALAQWPIGETSDNTRMLVTVDSATNRRGLLKVGGLTDTAYTYVNCLGSVMPSCLARSASSTASSSSSSSSTSSTSSTSMLSDPHVPLLPFVPCACDLDHREVHCLYNVVLYQVIETLLRQKDPRWQAQLYPPRAHNEHGNGHGRSSAGANLRADGDDGAATHPKTLFARLKAWFVPPPPATTLPPRPPSQLAHGNREVPASPTASETPRAANEAGAIHEPITKRGLYVGVGTGLAAMVIQHKLGPNVEMEGVEIDGDSVHAGRMWFGLDPGMKVHVASVHDFAQRFVNTGLDAEQESEFGGKAEEFDQYDFVVVDCFDGYKVPEACKGETIGLYRSLLREGGFFIHYTIDKVFKDASVEKEHAAMLTDYIRVFDRVEELELPRNGLRGAFGTSSLIIADMASSSASPPSPSSSSPPSDSHSCTASPTSLPLLSGWTK